MVEVVIEVGVPRVRTTVEGPKLAGSLVCEFSFCRVLILVFESRPQVCVKFYVDSRVCLRSVAQSFVVPAWCHNGDSGCHYR
jgi:hypothetical protein